MAVKMSGKLTAVIFILIVAVGTYLVFDLEALTDRELAFVERLETDVATALGRTPQQFFPKAGRLPSKFQMGGTPPAIYKLKMTTGRRGRRLTFDLSVKRTASKANGKFEGRWKHELRANRLGKLSPVPLKILDSSHHRLAKIRTPAGQVIGVFFLAQRGRSIFGLTLKGIQLEEFADFEQMLLPTLETVEKNGSELMLK